MRRCGPAAGPTTWLLPEQLRAADSAQRIHAVKSLAKRPKEADLVVPALAAALKDEDAFVRRDAAEALGRLGSRARNASPELLAALKDKNRQVRKTASAALKKVDPEGAMKGKSP